ncbi:hypothetical protein H6F50_21300 [Coleofasciculus sp. FACHB-712]|uniref:hypothetical protein n=1 Tax=Coleofasciculus sp. FACHB-712 TaxID=2692789 RepID=UPI0016832943|nr:hypothetical protein [Coleofasciculus sp. FACHB-712]MBD1944863.1 hypothetical protein [Coleofasciculus sp. FACHB-712]
MEFDRFDFRGIGNQSLLLQASNESTAKAWLDEGGCELAKVLIKLRLKYARITWDGCNQPLKILASMAESEPETPDLPEISNAVFSSQLGLDSNSLGILERMQGSSKPMSLTDLDSDAQEWVNAPLAQMLQMPAVQATSLNMKDYWQEDALDYVKRILGQQSIFDHKYEAMLPYSPTHFSSRFEVVEFGITKRLKRLVTIHYFEPSSQSAIQ